MGGGCVVVYCLKEHFSSMDNSIENTVSWDRAIGPLKLHLRLDLPRGLFYTLVGFMTPTRDCSANLSTTWQANQAESPSIPHTGKKTKSRAELHCSGTTLPSKLIPERFYTKLTNQVEWCKSGGKRQTGRGWGLGTRLGQSAVQKCVACETKCQPGKMARWLSSSRKKKIRDIRNFIPVYGKMLKPEESSPDALVSSETLGCLGYVRSEVSLTGSVEQEGYCFTWG